MSIEEQLDIIKESTGTLGEEVQALRKLVHKIAVEKGVEDMPTEDGWLLFFVMIDFVDVPPNFIRKIVPLIMARIRGEI